MERERLLNAVESTKVSEAMNRIDNVARLACLSYGEKRGRGTNVNPPDDPFIYASLAIDSGDITSCLINAGILDYQEVRKELALIYGGGVWQDPYSTSLGVYMKRAEKEGEFLSPEKENPVIRGDISFHLESTTRSEDDVTDEGYEYYPIIDRGQFTFEFPTKLKPGEKPYVKTYVSTDKSWKTFLKQSKYHLLSASELESVYDFLSTEVRIRIQEKFEAKDDFEEWIVSESGQHWAKVYAPHLLKR